MKELFLSNFASYMEGVIKQKRNAGFSLMYMEKNLHEFDIFCRECFPSKRILDKEIIEKWVYNTNTKKGANDETSW